MSNTDDLPPNLPALIWPGTAQAYQRGCTCPVAENINRLRLGAKPLFRQDCRLHRQICQAEECGHGGHWGVHWSCEHCTNQRQMCVVCEAVYLETDDDPSEHGWLFEGDDPVVRGWRCRTCRGY
jgi:hypothetical protein